MATLCWRVAIVLMTLCLLMDDLMFGAQAGIYYNFKRYPFRKKQKNERKIRGKRTPCESSAECQGKYGLEQVACVRRCMDEDCYNELYAHDELEEGEIDVRFNSFKGCVVDHMKP